MTKKPNLQNLNWENVIRSKSACLDERDPIAPAMPEPIDTNWGIRSDTEYDLKNRRKPLKMADDQATNQDEEPGIVESIGSIKNSVHTYAREDKPEPLDRMVERALGALRFVKTPLST